MDAQELIVCGLHIACCLVAMLVLLEFENRMARKQRRKNHPGP